MRPYSISIGWSTGKSGGFRASRCTSSIGERDFPPLPACTVGPPPIDEGVELAKNDTEVLLPTDSDASEDEDKKKSKPLQVPSVSPSFDLSRVVDEKEMRLLVQGELKDREGLLHPYYRGALAAVLAPKLKLVKTSVAKSPETGRRRYITSVNVPR